MEQYVVKGGVPLRGEVSIGGAKNAALGILAAAIMTDETVTIENVPNVRDTRVLLQAIEGIGAEGGCMAGRNCGRPVQLSWEDMADWRLHTVRRAFVAECVVG